MGKKIPTPPIIWFDTTKKYKTDMLPISAGRHRTYEYEEHDVIVNISQDKKDGGVKIYAEGYQDKWVYDVYFDWLLYTKYIVPID